MKDLLFFNTIQYLDSLHEEGLLGEAKTRKLAQFSLDLCNARHQRKTAGVQDVKFVETLDREDDETYKIVSDVLNNDWDTRD